MIEDAIAAWLFSRPFRGRVIDGEYEASEMVLADFIKAKTDTLEFIRNHFVFLRSFCNMSLMEAQKGRAPVIEPRDRSFEDPAFWEDNQIACVRALGDFDVDPAADPFQPFLKFFFLLAAVRVNSEQERNQSELRARQQASTAISRTQ